MGVCCGGRTCAVRNALEGGHHIAEFSFLCLSPSAPLKKRNADPAGPIWAEDKEEAVRWYRKAAEQGSASAMQMLRTHDV